MFARWRHESDNIMKVILIEQLACVQQEGAPFALIWLEFLSVIDLKKQKPRVLNFQRTEP